MFYEKLTAQGLSGEYLFEKGFHNFRDSKVWDSPRWGENPNSKNQVLRGAATPRRNVDENRLAEASQHLGFHGFKYFVFSKIPGNRFPPAGGNHISTKLVFARGPKTPANKLTIIDWPKPPKI